MKLIIREPRTLQYFTTEGRWTADQDNAAVFNSTQAAVKFCVKRKLSDVQVVAVFRDRSVYVRSHVPKDFGSRHLDRSGRYFLSAPMRLAA